MSTSAAFTSVSYTHLDVYKRQPHGHAALGVGPADTDETGLGSLPGVRTAAHPVGGVLQGNTANAVLFGQGHSAIHAEGGVQGANAQVAIIVLNSTLCTDQLGLSIDVDPALLDILGKAGHTVQAVALDAFQTALGVDLSALFSLLLAQAQIQERLRNGRFDSFIRYARCV